MKFLTEFFQRFSLKSPAFFQVIQALSIITGVISGLPLLIEQFQTDLGIAVPSWMVAISSKAVMFSAVVAWIIAKLPVKTPDVPAVAEKLPFTNKSN